jgi:hypothetical protein
MKSNIHLDDTICEMSCPIVIVTEMTATPLPKKIVLMTLRKGDVVSSFTIQAQERYTYNKDRRGATEQRQKRPDSAVMNTNRWYWNTN